MQVKLTPNNGGTDGSVTYKERSKNDACSFDDLIN